MNFVPPFPWLPQLEPLSSHGGDWHKYLAAIYSIFRADFIESKPVFRGSALALKRHPVIDGKEATFWHIISEGATENDRMPDMRRCERIRWPKPSIENCDAENVKIWTEDRGGEQRIHVWMEAESYLVVLNQRREYTLLWTAYFVDRDHQRRKLNQRYERHKKAEAATRTAS